MKLVTANNKVKITQYLPAIYNETNKIYKISMELF